jgi:hypothetical protein
MLNSNAMNASTELAHLKPRFVYILCAARGRKAAKMFSPKHTAALALAAYFAYASVTYIIIACMTTVTPKPMKAKPMAGRIHGSDG